MLPPVQQMLLYLIYLQESTGVWSGEFLTISGMPTAAGTALTYTVT